MFLCTMWHRPLCLYFLEKRAENLVDSFRALHTASTRRPTVLLLLYKLDLVSPSFTSRVSGMMVVDCPSLCGRLTLD